MVLGGHPGGVDVRGGDEGEEVLGEVVAQAGILGKVALRPVEGLVHTAHTPFGVGMLPGAYRHAVRVGAAEAVGIPQGGAVADARVGIPPGRPHIAVLVDLGTAVPGALVVASPQGHGAGQHLNVDAVAAARAVVDEQVGESLQQSIPEPPEIVDVMDLGGALALAVGVGIPIRAVPGSQRVEVEVLAVAVHPHLGDHLGDALNELIADLVFADVDEHVVVLGAVRPEVVRPLTDRPPHPLRLEPELELHAPLVEEVGDVAVAHGMVELVDLPRAHIAPVGGLGGGGGGAERLVPARVHPAVIEGIQPVGQDTLPALHQLVGGDTAPEDGGEGALGAPFTLEAAHGGHGLADEPPPEVVGVDLPLSVGHNGGGGGAEGLAGSHAEGDLGEAVTDAENRFPAVKVSLPLTRPAQGGQHTVLVVAALVDLKEGGSTHAAPSRLVADLLMIPRPHTVGGDGVVVIVDVGAVGDKEAEGLRLPRVLLVAAGAGGVGSHGDGQIAVAEVLDQRASAIGGIAPVVRPAGHAVVLQKFRDHRQLHSVGEGVDHAVGLASHRDLQLIKGRPAVGKGEGGHRDGTHRGGAAGADEVVQRLAGGLGTADALVLARVVAVVHPLFLSLARVDEGVQGIAVLVGTDEDHVAGEKLLHRVDAGKTMLQTPIRQPRAADALAVDVGLIRKARAVQDPIHQTVTADDAGIVVEGGVDGGVTVDKFLVADGIADALGVVEDGGADLPSRGVEHPTRGVVDSTAVEGVFVGKGAGFLKGGEDGQGGSLGCGSGADGVE